MESIALFQESLDWLKDHYRQYQFFTERDIVWTMQTYLNKEIKEHQLPYRVLTEWPIEQGNRKSLCADLAIMQGSVIEIAAEFKYEPDHDRKEDFSEKKLNSNIVAWNKHGIGDDVARVQRFVKDKKANVACSIFIDEGKRFRHREAFAESQWHDWEKASVSVLICWAKKHE